jgi:hypothetical protein
VPSSSPETRVLILTRDLFFRAKLEGLAKAAGALAVRDEPAELAVLELSGEDAVVRVGEFAGRGVPVIAFASHVQAALLRAARDAGAVAVPNSQVEGALRQWLAGAASPLFPPGLDSGP